jgi:hypothetical protein
LAALSTLKKLTNLIPPGQTEKAYYCHQMETIKFKYSTYQTWFAVILLSSLICFCLYSLKTNNRGSVLDPMLLFIAILAGLLIYTCYKFLLPLLQGKTILELDQEKLQYVAKNRVIHWKDIARMDYNIGSQTGNWAIRFVMKDGSPDQKVSTLYIAGKDKAIYDTIADYFEKYG